MENLENTTGTGKIFDEDNRLYKFYINSTMNDQPSIDFVKSLFKLELIDLDKSENQDLLHLYEIVGFDKFFEIVAFFGSRNVRFPKLDKLKKLLITAIAYYQLETLKLSPKDAGKILSEKLGLLNLKQKNLKSLVDRLEMDVENIVNSTLKRMILEEKDRVSRPQQITEEEDDKKVNNDE